MWERIFTRIREGAEYKQMEHKTNAMRELDKLKVKYTFHSYTQSDAVSGMEVASELGENPDHVFKTLVTVGKSGKHYVFIFAC